VGPKKEKRGSTWGAQRFRWIRKLNWDIPRKRLYRQVKKKNGRKKKIWERGLFEKESKNKSQRRPDSSKSKEREKVGGNGKGRPQRKKKKGRREIEGKGTNGDIIDRSA